MQEQQHSTEKIQEVANVITGIDLHLALEAVMQLKRSLSLELNFVRNRQQAQEREFREFMNELWKTLSNIQAQFRIDATLLHLIKPEEAGEQKCQGKRNSNRSRMLDGFAKSGS
jgi:hypothetical protein